MKTDWEPFFYLGWRHSQDAGSRWVLTFQAWFCFRCLSWPFLPTCHLSYFCHRVPTRQVAFPSFGFQITKFSKLKTVFYKIYPRRESNSDLLLRKSSTLSTTPSRPNLHLQLCTFLRYFSVQNEWTFCCELLLLAFDSLQTCYSALNIHLRIGPRSELGMAAWMLVLGP